MLVVLVSGTAPTDAADAGQAVPDQTLRKVERDLTSGRDRQSRLERQSATLRADLLALRERLVAASDAAARQTAELGGIEAALAHFEADEKVQTTNLAGHRRDIQDLVGALYRLSLTPPEALIVRPEAPIDALRTALLLRQALPTLRQRADTLTVTLGRLQDLRQRLKIQRDELAATRTGLAERLKEIAGMVSEREALARETDAERQQNAQRMASLASQATDLRQLLERIEADRKAEAERRAAVPPKLPDLPKPADFPSPPAEPEPVSSDSAVDAAPVPAEPVHRALDEHQRRDIDRLATLPPSPALAPPTAVRPPVSPEAPATATSRGMRLPASGRVALAYGDIDRYGTTSRGLHIAAQSGSPVVAPMDGTIKFAGRFRNYGQILIVEHRNGYHSLIAGLGRIDTTVGRPVSAGEPIGVVADPADGVPDLYFELRRNGQPINPRRGIPALDGKGRG